MHPFRLFVLSSCLSILAACGEHQGGATAGRLEKNPVFENKGSHLPLIQTLTLQSLVPRKIQLPVGVNLIDEGWPQGLRYDAENHIISWLPQQNQAGAYELKLSQEQRDGVLVLEVEAQPEETLRLGPPRSYRDGDVGYIYVHGMSMTNYCATDEKGWKAWRAAADIVSPDENTRSAVCYDGRGRVDQQAAAVAQQIIDAPCGAFNRCIMIAHSMGGLMIEYILLHADESSHPDAAERELFRRVREKILFVVELGSASGGAEVANVVKYPERYPKLKHLMGSIGKLVPSRDAIDVLALDFATQIGAPLNGNPQVPVFMVPGYSRKNLLSKTQKTIRADGPFNGRLELAALDRSMALNSRSDGVVTFRSACGIASDDETAGPGYKASLNEQFEYCFLSPKKPQHHVWFSMDLNHYAIASPFSLCQSEPSSCQVHTLDTDDQIIKRTDLQGMDSMQVMRYFLANATDAEPSETAISM